MNPDASVFRMTHEKGMPFPLAPMFNDYGLVSNTTLLGDYIRSTGKIPYMPAKGVEGNVKIALSVLRPLIAAFAEMQSQSYDPHLVISYGEYEVWPTCTRDVENICERDILSREQEGKMCRVKANSFLSRTIRNNALTLGVNMCDNHTDNGKSLLVRMETVNRIIATWALLIDPKAVSSSSALAGPHLTN